MTLSLRLARQAALLTTATIVMAVPAIEARAQQAAEPAPLPQITVEAAKKKKAAQAAKKSSTPSVKKSQAAPPAAEPDVVSPADTAAGGASGGPAADAQGDIGYNATRTSTATKTDTPLRNVPQSISVITDQQIKDQNIKSIGDATKYVPGVTTGTGEGNRDQISIRGQNTTADFFVDGVRDDAQIFRDFYNIERLEVLKGPNALIFGRGGGGGIVNRVTKRADFFTLNEGTVTIGSYGNKRAAADVNHVINPFVAVRLNAMYEDADSFRDHVELERWGVNPTITFRPQAATRIMLGYEHFEDERTADRGVPSYRRPGENFNRPVPGNRSTFFGNPDLSVSDAKIDSVFATIEHAFGHGLKVRNHTLYANYDKFYQNVFASGAADAALTTVPLQAYNQQNDRENIFNQTDITYKLDLGIMRHTIMGGAEFGYQKSRNYRENGFFAGFGDTDGVGPNEFGTPIANTPYGGCSSIALSNGGRTSTCNVPFGRSTIFSPEVVFRGVNNQTNNSVEANVRSFYIQDQMELTRYLEVIGGVRHDTFEFDLEDYNAAAGSAFRNISRTDDLTSPRAGVILKPTDALSFYGSYAVSYLPFSGDQFNSLTNVTVTADPEKFTNYELGAKWDVTPALSLAVAHYWLKRENSRFTGSDPNVVIQTGATEVEGTEVTLNGYLTDKWQVAAGYAHQKGEVTSATSVAVGTELPFLPSDTFSLWNRYQFSSMWGAGVGVVHRTDMFAALSNVGEQTIVPEYTTVDAALYFKLNDNFRAQLNVENILGENYYVSAHNNNNLAPGAPTTVYGSITSNF